MRIRTLLVVAIALLALTAATPSAAALHAGDASRTETACNGTVCVTLRISIHEGTCAYIPLGTPCEVIVYGSLSGQSALGGSASGQLHGYSMTSCSWSALQGSCHATFQDAWRASYRGEWVCVTGSASAQDALYVASISFTHCYEAH